jgi:hypothetical protein
MGNQFSSIPFGAFPTDALPSRSFPRGAPSVVVPAIEWAGGGGRGRPRSIGIYGTDTKEGRQFVDGVKARIIELDDAEIIRIITLAFSKGILN